jgi:hypothetical protein
MSDARYYDFEGRLIGPEQVREINQQWAMKDTANELTRLRAEIERLRAERDFDRAHIESLQNKLAQASAEVVALEDEAERLKQIAGLPDGLAGQLRWLVETYYYPKTQEVPVPLLRDILEWHEQALKEEG